MKIRERNISLTSYHEHVEIKLFPLKKKTHELFLGGVVIYAFLGFLFNGRNDQSVENPTCHDHNSTYF